MDNQADNLKILELQKKIEQLRGLLEEKEVNLLEAKETLEAIRSGAVDGLVRSSPDGDQLFILKGSDQPYRNLIEEMHEGALLISSNGTILYCNSGFAKLVKTRLDNLMGHNIKEWLSASGLEIFSRLPLNDGIMNRVVYEITFRTTDAQLVPALISINTISMGTINAMALIVTDLTQHMEEDVKQYTENLEKEITERRKIETALKESDSKLQDYANNLENLVKERTRQLQEHERLAAIGQVAGMVGHDIRNPLQAIVSELYLAKESIKDGSKDQAMSTIESIDFIQEQVDYINKIVADLQDFAKQLKPEFTTVELCQFIPDTVKTITIPDNIETVLICEKQLPPIKLDKIFTTRVLTNLATNAIQAMPKGGKLTIQAIKRADSALITVEDTGVGIPEEVQKKLFTPLFTTKSKGQGFGLAVVKRLVEAEGGSINYESSVGKGTKFFIKLPIK